MTLQCFHLARSAQSQSTSKQVLDTEFSDYVEHLRDVWDVKGIAMAVVKPGDDVEFGVLFALILSGVVRSMQRTR